VTANHLGVVIGCRCLFGWDEKIGISRAVRIAVNLEAQTAAFSETVYMNVDNFPNFEAQIWSKKRYWLYLNAGVLK
jgi:hypothetical protein